jgi:nucleotide-binding universal stress UspA family protein
MNSPGSTSSSRLDERPTGQSSGAAQSSDLQSYSRIAVGVDDHPEGRDAAALGAALAWVTGAELMLATVQSPPLVPLPPDMGWRTLREGSQLMLRAVRDSLAPTARTVAETDLSVARALHRIVREQHRDLLVVGSSRHAREGRVRIGKRTRQLLCHFECALAVAPRGIHSRPDLAFRRIAVGYDGGPESASALAMAGSIAHAAGAELHVCAVVDDRIPRIAVYSGITEEWGDVIEQEMNRAHEWASAAARDTGGDVHVDVLRGRPADGLLELSEQVDLLVIGSRRWGPARRVLLGSTGEAVMHDAACAVLAVPRPADPVTAQ